jgi:hypothetical protein
MNEKKTYNMEEVMSCVDYCRQDFWTFGPARQNTSKEKQDK